MHEMGIVRDVVDMVLATARESGATKVTRVDVTVGYGRDVIENLMQGLFRRLAHDTIASEAELVITRVPITVRCNQCATVFPVNLYREETWTCPTCGAKLDYELQTGMEFFISNVEISI